MLECGTLDSEFPHILIKQTNRGWVGNKLILPLTQLQNGFGVKTARWSAQLQ